MKQKGFSLLFVVIIITILGFGYFVVDHTLKNLCLGRSLRSKLLANPQPNSYTTPQSSPSSRYDPQKLEKYLIVETALLGVSDNISVFFKDLNNSQQISIDPTRSWIPASTIKAYVLLEAFRQKRLGNLNFEDTVKIQADNVVPTELETDDYPHLKDGTQLSVRQLIEMMIVQSDNIAYNTLLDILDRRLINQSLKELGFTETVVGEKLNLDENQLQKDLAVLGRQPNTTTAKDFATFFEMLYNKKIPESEEILAVFKKQKINNMIPALLPVYINVAHKTGDWAPIYHDGGVIYKPSSPFILTVFSNSNDPTVIAKIAKVAYYQNLAVVGEKLDDTDLKKQAHKKIVSFMANFSAMNEQVLGESSNEQFPKITASDLGITTSDLTTDVQEAGNAQRALILPDSLLYPLKRYIEKLQLDLAQDNSLKVQIYLNQARARLAESKSLLERHVVDQLNSSLEQSEEDLQQATYFAQKEKSAEVELLQIKQLTDLHFAVLSQIAPSLPTKNKEQFVDAIFNFYQKNKQEVLPVVKRSLIADPLVQQPVIGTVIKTNSNSLVLQFDDGSTKEVILPTSTPVRAFNQEKLDTKPQIRTGVKLAVVGETTKDGKVLPVFILRDIPPQLPQRHKGLVVEINSDKSTLKIEQVDGQKEEIVVNPSTVVKSKDTNVSIEGIKAGSSVTVFGQTQSNQAAVPPVIQATSVTVTKNSSGANEKSTKVKPLPSKKEEGSKNLKESSKKDQKK